MRDWRSRLLDRVAHGPVVMVTVIATEGSTPREVGARMLVDADGIEGSIGGGQLEFQETAAAQALLRSATGTWQREVHRIVLGPDAGQCCGGVVEVLHEIITAHTAAVLAAIPDDGILVRCVDGPTPMTSCADDGSPDFSVVWQGRERQFTERLHRTATPLYFYGAGHVARALVRVMADLPFDIRWLDFERARFPADVAPEVRVIVTTAPAQAAHQAPPRSLHLVMTHSHDVDFDICRALLVRSDLAFVGLIGSQTKRARFAQRLLRDGIAAECVQRLVCPIGLGSVPGKAPQAIAIAVAAQLLALKA